MRNSPILSALAVASLTLPNVALAMGQQVPMVPPSLPAELAINELPEGYQAYALGTNSTGNAIESLMGTYARIGVLSGNNQLIELLGASWTRGDVVNGIGESRYLVTYRIDAPGQMSSVMNMGRVTDQFPQQPAKFRLNLIRLDNVVSISPIKSGTREAVINLLGTPPQKPIVVLKNETISNLKQAALGMVLYAGDYDDVYPYVQSSKAAFEVTYPYVKNKDVFKTLNPNGGQIQFAMNLGGVLMTSLPDPASTPMYYESVAWPDGSRVVAYADGHVKTASASQWPTIEQYLRKVYPRTAKKPLPAKLGLGFSATAPAQDTAVPATVK